MRVTDTLAPINLSYFVPLMNSKLRKVCHSKLLIRNNYFKGEEVNRNTIEKMEMIS